jgi:hypothetical protein
MKKNITKPTKKKKYSMGNDGNHCIFLILSLSYPLYGGFLYFFFEKNVNYFIHLFCTILRVRVHIIMRVNTWQVLPAPLYKYVLHVIQRQS